MGEEKKQTSAISNNTINALKKKKKKHNISEITYFNCDKKSYYANISTKSSKISISLGDFCVGD